jgi:hypothetical protein
MQSQFIWIPELFRRTRFAFIIPLEVWGCELGGAYFAQTVVPLIKLHVLLNNDKHCETSAYWQ